MGIMATLRRQGLPQKYKENHEAGGKDTWYIPPCNSANLTGQNAVVSVDSKAKRDNIFAIIGKSSSVEVGNRKVSVEVSDVTELVGEAQKAVRRGRERATPPAQHR